MPRQQKANPEFGQWVVVAREAVKLTQKNAAQRAGIKQQIWSRIERYGIIPSTEKLINICKALDQSIDNLKPLLDGASNVDLRVRNYELDYLGFTRLLIQRANMPGRNDVVELFVLREDQEPFDEDTVREQVRLLGKTDKFALTTLFRDSNPGAWQSFRKLARVLSSSWKGPIEDLRRKYAGYYRKPEYEEDRSRRLPMPHPVMLVVGVTARPALYSYDVHGRVLKQLKERDRELPEATAELQSTMVWPVYSDKLTSQYIDWIGAVSRADLPADRWQRVEWPDDI